MAQNERGRTSASHLTFLIIFTALFAGGIVVTFFAAPLFALTPLQGAVALILTLFTGSAAVWELRCLVVARRHRRRSERTRSI
ncbi:hypothetical protein [uncultured Microbacterium sp.]|uniref:hypothetical protein n=1 Tax=uncultured Microbacterium sp. TaxID=191216 RepID=UPI0028D187B7|nr:hypothetical protein [uncultured Microbacterium sp.]